MVAQKLNDLGVDPADFDDVVFVWRNVVDNGYFVVAACLTGIFNAVFARSDNLADGYVDFVLFFWLIEQVIVKGTNDDWSLLVKFLY